MTWILGVKVLAIYRYTLGIECERFEAHYINDLFVDLMDLC